MKRFNKLFAKKDRADDHVAAAAIDSSTLASMSASDLCTLIYKYDEELKRINPILLTTIEERDKALSDSQKRSEESTLYKHLAEVLSTQSVQEQLTGLTAELSDVKEVLQSKKAEVDLLRSQMLTLEEMHAAVRKELTESESKLIEFGGKTTGNEGSSTSESEEITRLRGEIARLSVQNRETNRVEQRCKELEIVKKNLEAELLKMSRAAESLNSELKNSKEKLAEMHGKVGALDACKQEAASFAFMKESMENEIRALKEINERKEGIIGKKKEKMNGLKEELDRTKDKMDRCKGKWDGEKREIGEELNRVKEELQREKVRNEEVMKGTVERLQGELNGKLREIDELTCSLKITQQNIDEKETKIASLEEEISVLSQTTKSQQAQITTHSSELHMLKSQLEEAQKKREQARVEVIKLSQRLEQRASPRKEESQKPGSAFFPVQVPDEYEIRVLMRVKKEVDGVYKSLMKAMLTAKDVPYPNEDLTTDTSGLLVESSLFSTVERQLNNLQMSLLELTESPEVLLETLASTATPQSWSGRISSAMANIKQTVKSVGPVKLFSCMPTGREKQHPKNMEMKPKSEQGRKMMSHTGGSLPVGPNDSSDSISRKRF